MGQTKTKAYSNTLQHVSVGICELSQAGLLRWQSRPSPVLLVVMFGTTSLFRRSTHLCAFFHREAQ